ncbi:Arc family DNA-binding protein [Comamonadaceae bacterium PP-2]
MATGSSPTGRDSDKFMLRFPDGMRDRIADSARAGSRSMNAEVVARLEASFNAQGCPVEILTVIAKLQLELSHANYQERTSLIERRVLIQAVEELVRWIRNSNLDEKIRNETLHFSKIEAAVDENQFASGLLKDEAQKSELELLEAKRRRDDALDALAKMSSVSMKE